MVLRFQSPTVLRTYEGSAPPGEIEVESWVLRDDYRPPVDGDRRRQHGEYRLHIECSASTAKQVNDLHFKAIKLAGRVVRIWPYALGSHFESPWSGTSIELVEPPKGWESNRSAILAELRKGGPERSISFDPSSFGPPIRWTRAFWWPLDRIATALRFESRLSEPEQELLALHAVAHGARSGRAFTVLLSTAFELAMALLPGATKAEKNALMVSEAGQVCSATLTGLWRVANTRRQTRHAVAHRDSPMLHPAMDATERDAYIADVDAVIRFVLCRGLGLDFVAVSKAQ